MVYLVAPQVWAWRQGRLRAMRRDIRRLLCIFPFEEAYFRERGMDATYLGHPLAGLVRPALARDLFFKKHGLPPGRPLITVMPGSRCGEAARHLPALLEAVDRLYRSRAATFLLPASVTTGAAFFKERIGEAPIQVIEGENWDAMAHADVVLAASGTVTVEAALVGTPMVTFYRVNPVSWSVGKPLVRVPFYSMVNFVAGRAVVPEIMQSEMTGERLAAEVALLLDDAAAREAMRQALAGTAHKLMPENGDAMSKAAALIADLMEGHVARQS